MFWKVFTILKSYLPLKTFEIDFRAKDDLPRAQ